MYYMTLELDFDKSNVILGKPLKSQIYTYSNISVSMAEMHVLYCITKLNLL